MKTRLPVDDPNKPVKSGMLSVTEGGGLVLGLDDGLKVRLSDEPSVMFPTEIFVNESIEVTIANFDSFIDYQVSTNFGAVSDVVDGFFTLTAPEEPVLLTLTIKVDGIGYTYDLEIISPYFTARTVQLSSGPSGRYHHTFTACNGKMYLIGGYGGVTDRRGDVWEYDPITDIWTEKAPIPNNEFRQQHAACTDGSRYIYISGGKSGSAPKGSANDTDTVLRYDVVTNVWTILPHRLHAPMSDHASFYYNYYIYTVGGRLSDGSSSDLIYRFRTSDTTITQRSPIPDSRHAAVTLSNVLDFWLFGGASNGSARSSCYHYNIQTNTWTDLGLSYNNRYTFGFYTDDKPFVYGGIGTSNTTDSNNPLVAFLENGEFTSVGGNTFISSPHYYSAGGIIDNKLFVFGGRNSEKIYEDRLFRIG